MKKKTPIVAIVGRANVGKSSLFNALIGQREAIVADEAGTTRDAIWRRIDRDDQSLWLVDTAGMKRAEDSFELSIQEQITQATESADIILVVIEADAPITQEDRRVAKIALKSKKEVQLVINKIDKAKHADLDAFKQLGITQKHHTSTTQRTGVKDLLNSLFSTLPKVSTPETADTISVALLGRPNVGKSSLFNTLLKKQEAVVSDIAGTTRDVNQHHITYHGKKIILSDTAGIRRSGRIEKGVEHFSVLRSLAAIESSDICVLLIDGTEPSVQLDQKVAGMVKEANKGLILAVSKWDVVEKDAYTRDGLARQLRHDFTFVPWASLLFTSAETGQNVTKLLELVDAITKEQSQIITTSKLNSWMKDITAKHSPAGLKSYQPTLKYIVQESDNPTNFKVYGRHTKWLHWSYKRYMERELRETFGFDGTAIRFWFFDDSDPRRAAARRQTITQKRRRKKA